MHPSTRTSANISIAISIDLDGCVDHVPPVWVGIKGVNTCCTWVNALEVVSEIDKVVICWR